MRHAGLDPAICCEMASDPRVKPGDHDVRMIEPDRILLYVLNQKFVRLNFSIVVPAKAGTRAAA
jgi:hypothetical protein